MKKILLIGLSILALVTTGLAGYVGWSLYPHENFLPLPAPLIAANTEEGANLLKNADNIADYKSLMLSFEPQSLASYCGVASSVAVLNALGLTTSQKDFFTDKANLIRSQVSVMRGGMSLAELAGLLTAHGLKVSINHSDNFSIADFRATLEKNLSTAGDYLIINYQREALGQGRVGHISPISAYDRVTDSVLIMDTATHKYPHTWVPVELLFAAMNTADPASGKMRGFVEVSK